METDILRTFSPRTTRLGAVHSLLKKYESGKRGVSDVLEGAAALRAQNHDELADVLLIEAMGRVRPVPTTLWLQACRRMSEWKYPRIRYLLTIARDDTRCARMFDKHAHALPRDGVMAVMYEVVTGHAWARDLAIRLLHTFAEATALIADGRKPLNQNFTNVYT